MLKKINWKFRKTHITLTPLIVFVNDTWDGWGFDFLNIKFELFSLFFYYNQQLNYFF